MSKSSEFPQANNNFTLREMQDMAFEAIPVRAERYARQPHATAVYVQDALFAHTIAQQQDEDDLRIRDDLMDSSEDDMILFPDEFRDLRLRAAYHGAGLATELATAIPRKLHHRLSDNLSNYPTDMDYEQLYFPWTYRIQRVALRSILLHDFSIAAQDYADGDLNRLCAEFADEEFIE